jgi:thioredoxin-related protein
MYSIKDMTTGIVFMLLVGLFAVTANAAEIQLQEANDLQADAARAGEDKLPILVLFSSSYCGYCTIVREDFLKPMLISGDYDDKVIMRVVNIDSTEGLRDFEGREVDAEAFADRRGVFVTPTVKFFGPDGNETTSDLVGLSTVDYYGGFLDTAIEESLVHLRGDSKVAQNK